MWLEKIHTKVLETAITITLMGLFDIERICTQIRAFSQST